VFSRKSFGGILALTVLVALAAFSQQRANAFGDDPAKFDARLETAMLHNDLPFFKQALADDVRFTHGTGMVWDKTKWLEAVPRAKFTLRDLSSVEIERHGDLVETIGHIHVRSSNTAAPEYHIWYVRVYVRRKGEWQLVSNRTVHQVNGPTTDK
jgi:ketosteroid isomerase-like protein